MKSVLKVAILTLVALSVGYNRGYYEGLKTERSAWESTAHSKDSILHARQVDHGDGSVTLYSNPRNRFFFAPPFGKVPVNAIDYRNVGGNTSRAVTITLTSD